MIPRHPFPTPSSDPTPLLDALQDQGIIRMDHRLRAYWAVNAAGVELILGTMGGEVELERYLTKHPTPDTWAA